jgi:hypothetical protein
LTLSTSIASYSASVAINFIHTVPAAAKRAEAAISKAIDPLEIFPFSCCKAISGSGSPFSCELIVSFGRSGDLALFETEGPRTVTVLTVGYQRQADYQ